MYNDNRERYHIRCKTRDEMIVELRTLAPVKTRGRLCSTSYRNLNRSELEALLLALGVRHPSQERRMMHDRMMHDR